MITIKEVDYAILIITELENEWYKPPTAYYTVKKTMFEMQSYQRWAMAEIKKAIREHWDSHPIDTMEYFVYSMDKKACETSSPEMNFICSIACDVGREVLDTLRAALL